MSLDSDLMREAAAVLRSPLPKGKLMYYPIAAKPQPWPKGPCAQVQASCALCDAGLGTGGGLVLCVQCGEALRDRYSPLGMLLREAYHDARRAALAVADLREEVES